MAPAQEHVNGCMLGAAASGDGSLLRKSGRLRVQTSTALSCVTESSRSAGTTGNRFRQGASTAEPRQHSRRAVTSLDLYGMYASLTSGLRLRAQVVFR